MALSLSEYRQKYPQYKDVDDDTLAKALYKKYYSSMDFDEFSSRLSAPTTDPEVQPESSSQPITSGGSTSNASAYLKNIAETEGRDPTIEEQNEAVRMRREEFGKPEFPEETNKFNSPYQKKGSGKVSKFGQEVIDSRQARPYEPSESQKIAAKKLQEQDVPPEIPDRFLQGDRVSVQRIKDGDPTGLSSKSRQERIEESGKIIERMVSGGIRSAADYGISREDYDNVMRDRTQEEMQRRKAAADGAKSAGGIAEPTEGQKTEKSYWLATKKKFKALPEEFGRLFETGTADDVYKSQQYESLGAMYLDAVARQDPETADAANSIIADKADEIGVDPAMYHRTMAMQLDILAEETNATIDGVAAFQRELIENLPEAEWEDNKIGYITGKLIENQNSVAYMAIGVATRSPAVLATLMGSDVYARTYTDARRSGRSEGEAVQDAYFSSSIELATEGIPLARILKSMKLGNKSRSAKLLQGLGNEATQEMLVETLQMGYDIGVLDESISVGEAVVRLRDAGILGAVMGGGMAAPGIVAGDNQMNNLNKDVSEAKKKLTSIAMRAQNPDVQVKGSEIQAAKQAYADAIKAKGAVLVERKKAETEKKKSKADKKETKRVSKLTKTEQRQETAQKSAEAADQVIDGLPTKEDVSMAETLERAAEAELTEVDADGVQAALEAGYMKITGAGTAVVLPAGKRRAEAVRRSQQTEGQVDETIQPTPYDSPEKRSAQDKIDEEIGQRLRGEEVSPQIVEPKPFTSQQRRKQQLSDRVESGITDPDVISRIADDIIKAEQEETMFEQREQEVRVAEMEKRDESYDAAIEQQSDVAVDQANTLAELDEKGVSGYTGTRIGDVLRDAMNVIERAEKKAIVQLKKEFWAKPNQGELFDITGVLVKGTKQYANLVKVGALKIAKVGLKYSAWTADMVGEFGESVRPYLARIYHDAKKSVSLQMKLSHEKFATGPRKGELKYSPKQYAKPGAIRRLRDVMKKLADEGSEGRFWYEKSGREIRKMAGNTEIARKMAGLFAIYSSGTAVSANTTNALKMWAQFAAGKTQQPKQGTMAGRFSEQDKTALEWLHSKESDEFFAEKFGNKRFPFFQNIMRQIDPKNYEVGQGVTVDLWMMRAFGFEQDAPTDAQYAFITTEINELSKKLGWEPQQVQAAIWVSIKARWESIQKVAKQAAVDQGFAEIEGPVFTVLGKTREQEIENEKKIIGIFRDKALRLSTKELKKKLDESKKDFADNLEKHYATLSWESEPSSKLQTGLNNMSLADKVKMQVEMAEAMTNPETGREFLAEWLGLLGDGQFLGPGAWEMNIGAAVQNSVIAPAGHKTSADKTKTVQPESATALDGYSAILGLLFQQDAVAWHKPFYAGAKGRANGMEVLTQGPISPEQTQELYDAIVREASKANVNGIDWAPIVLDGAVRVLNFSEYSGVSNTEFHKIIQSALESVSFGSATIELFQSDGNMIYNDWIANPKGQQYVTAINESENPQVKKAFARAKRELAPRIEKIRRKYAGKKPNARDTVSVTRLTSDTKLKKVGAGKMRFRHFGKKDVTVLDVERWGTGIKGAERSRDQQKVISAYPNTGFKKEDGLGQNEYVIDVPKSKMYDMNEDRLYLKERAMEPTTHRMVKGKLTPVSWKLDYGKFEQLVREAGFLGYWTPKAEGNLKGQARFFHSLVVNNDNTKGTQQLSQTGSYAISSRMRVEVVENDSQEYEVREKNGEVYYTEDPDDAIGTARSIYGLDATVIIVDEHGDVITTDVAVTEPRTIKLRGFSGKPDADTTASIGEFVDEWVESTSQNPISSERIVDEVAAVELRPQGNHIWIDSIRSFNKGEGNGSQALKLIIELADMHGVSLRMTAKPFEAGGNELEYRELVAWYKRNGFVTEQEVADYEPSSTMVREPRVTSNRSQFMAWKKPKKSTGAGLGIGRAEVNAFVSSFGRQVGVGNFKVVATAEELPAELAAQAKLYPKGLNGAYYEDPIDGPTIYIVTDSLVDKNGNPSVELLQEVIMHETIGHFGLSAFLGKEDYNMFVDLIRKAFPTEVSAQIKHGQMQNTEWHKRLAAEEVFAYFVGRQLQGMDLSKTQTTLIDRIKLKLSIFLARLGFRKLSENDLHMMMFRVADYVRVTSEATLIKRAKQQKAMRKADFVVENKAYRKGRNIAEAELDSANAEWEAAHIHGSMTQVIRDRVSAAESAVENYEDMYETGAFMSKMEMKTARKEDPALDRFMSKIGHGRADPLATLRDWWELRKGNIKKSLEIEMLDQFAGIKHMERELGILGAESGYMSVRLTAGVDVVIRSALENGAPTWDVDGSVRMDSSHRGLIEILAPIAKDPDMLKAFEAFIIARRAKRLKKEDRENLFSREEIGAALKYIRKKKVYGLFKDTAAEMAAYKSKVLDFAEEAGVVDSVGRLMWEHNDHVPFYRVMSEKTGAFSGVNKLGKVGRVIHRLKGGKDPLKQPLQSIVENLSALIEASMKNRAMADVVKNFEGTGAITKAPQAEFTTALVPMSQVKELLFEAGVSLDAVGQEMLTGVQKLMALQPPQGDNVFSIQVDGKKQYYYSHDAGIQRGLDNVSPTQWTHLMRVLRFPKRVITRLITLMPDFILKNWFRDIAHTFVLARHGTIIPVMDSLKGWGKAIAHDETFKDVMSGGGMFDSGYVNATDPEKTKIAIRRGLLQKGRHNILDTPRKLKTFYMRIANGAENAHRLIVYEKALKATGSRKQALFEARDLMDFSVRGANPIVRFLTETVPFWGARVQGISRTAKGFTENPAVTLLRSAPIVFASIALYAINREDDRYSKLNDYEKRMYYHFYDVFEDGDHYRLPKPFEIGAIFSTIPEIMTELLLSEQPDRGKEAGLAIWWTVTEMLSLWPAIQAIQPLVELGRNKNSFTGAPIVSTWEKDRIDPAMQYSHNTSRTIKWLAEQMPDSAPEALRSPKQLEHLMKGYFASALDYTLVATDMIHAHMSDDPQPPSLRWDETPFFKSFKREEYGKYDIYMDSMYEVMAEADKIYSAIQKLKKDKPVGWRDKLDDYEGDNEALLYARKKTSSATSQVAGFNKRIRRVYASTTKTPDQKRADIDVLLAKRSRAAEKSYDYRPGGKKNRYTENKDIESFWDQLVKLTKKEQVDELISQQLPHTATLINDITIRDEKLRKEAE